MEPIINRILNFWSSSNENVLHIMNIFVRENKEDDIYDVLDQSLSGLSFNKRRKIFKKLKWTWRCEECGLRELQIKDKKLSEPKGQPGHSKPSEDEEISGEDEEFSDLSFPDSSSSDDELDVEDGVLGECDSCRRIMCRECWNGDGGFVCSGKNNTPNETCPLWKDFTFQKPHDFHCSKCWNKNLPMSKKYSSNKYKWECRGCKSPLIYFLRRKNKTKNIF